MSPSPALISSDSFLKDCAARRLIFFTGKGGVGKTTLAWATALANARRGRRVIVAGWAPFAGQQKHPFTAEGIEYVALDTLTAFREYALKIVRFERVYDSIFDNRVLRTFVLATPGLSDTVLAGKIWDLYDRSGDALVIVDLPSSGHAISFFSSPLGVKKVISVGFVHEETQKIVGMFGASNTRIDLVALPEELPLVECLQLKQKLEELHSFRFGFLHLNQCLPDLAAPEDSDLARFPEDARDAITRFRARVDQESEAAKLATDIGLPCLRLERYPIEGLRANVERVARELAGA